MLFICRWGLYWRGQYSSAYEIRGNLITRNRKGGAYFYAPTNTQTYLEIISNRFVANRGYTFTLDQGGHMNASVRQISLIQFFCLSRTA